MLDFVTILLLSLLGLFAGFMGGLLGIGGGVIVVPILVLAFGLDTQHAVGTSLFMILFTALSGTVAYYRQKRIDWKIGLCATLVTVPGAALGAYATKLFSSRSLAIVFGVTIVLIAAFMIRRSTRKATDSTTSKSAQRNRDASTSKRVWSRKIVDSAGTIFTYNADIYSSLIFLFFAGFASGLLGIGGGLIVVPVLAAFVGVPMHLAVATSMLTMIFTSISGVSTHIALGHVRFDLAVPLVIGILFGTQVGARTARRLKSAKLELVFGIAVLGIGVVLIIRQLIGI